MAKIFISYARKDAGEIADELADRLRAKDHEVFLDVQSIRAGARWRSELSRRIKWSDLIVVLVTEGSNASDYVYQEIREAEEHGKTIVPIKVGDASLPVHLRGTWQAITLENDNLDAILLELQSALLHSSGSRTLSPIIVAGMVIGVIVIVIVAFLLSQNGDRNQNTRSVTETSVAISVTENEISEPRDIITSTPINTSEPPTATNTDIPTPTDTPTITLTHTPRPTSTPRPPTATPSPTTAPTQIPEDRILISEDFEDGRTTGFVVAGNWQIVNDADGNAVYEVTATDWANAKFGRDNWRDYGVRFRFKVLKSVGRPVSLEFRNNGNEMYIYSFGSMDQGLSYTSRSRNWEWENLAFTGFNLQLNRWYDVTMETKGSSIRVTVDGTTIVDWEDDRISYGNVDLAVWIGSTVQFDDIVAWSLED